VKSNSVVLAAQHATVGIGQGQPSRVGAVRVALDKAGKRSQGSVVASDGFFPFPDSIDLLASAGVTAIVQPGGSIRDEAVVAAATWFFAFTNACSAAFFCVSPSVSFFAAAST